MKKLKIFGTMALLLLSFISTYSQTKRNRIWTINDSTGIDFTDLQNVVPFNTNVLKDRRYGTASIADTSGNLLLYSNGTNVWGRDNLLCLNSDSTYYCGGCKNGSFFIPSQLDSSIYFYFRTYSANAINNLEFWKLKTYPNGSCDMLNYQWKQMCGTRCSRKMVPIKHGNGKDWWIISMSDDNSQYCRMLFTNDSLYIFGNDSIEYALIHDNAGSHSLVDVSSDGSKIVQALNLNDTTDICLYNFDRCTGLLSFDKRIFFRPDAYQTQTDFFWAIRETVFSNDGQYVYAMTWDTLYQLNTTRDYTQQTPLVIWYDTNHVDYDDFRLMVAMERAPDGKIYVSRDYNPNVASHDSIHQFIGVIDSIDYSYPTAHFTRKGFYLGGRQSTGGLVQNVNYDLGPWVGSPCDTLTTTSISEHTAKPKITLYPNPAQTEATLTWSGVQEGTFVLRDMLGRGLMQQGLSASSGSLKVNLAEFSKGIYLWQVQSKVHAQNGKLVLE